METEVITDVVLQCEKNNAQWGGSDHDDKHYPSDWIEFIRKQHRKAERFVEDHNYVSYRNKMIEIAALAIQAAQSFDRKP